MSTMEERMSTVERRLADIADINREMDARNLRMQAVNEEMQAETRAMQAETRAMQAATHAFREATERAHREEAARIRELRQKSAHDHQQTMVRLRSLEKGWRDADRKWGELANKMGTLVEDIVAPGLPAVFRQVFGLERLDSHGQRVRRTHRTDRGRQREFDYVASSGDLLLINETKSTIRPEDIPAFVAVLTEARDYLPDAEGRAVVGALAGFSVDASLVAAGERQGLLMFGLGTGLLRVLNTPGFEPRRF